MPFLIKAMEYGKVIYSMHNGTTEDYINKKVLEYGGHTSLKKTYMLDIPHMFKFHKKNRKKIKTIMFRIEVNRV